MYEILKINHLNKSSTSQLLQKLVWEIKSEGQLILEINLFYLTSSSQTF